MIFLPSKGRLSLCATRQYDAAEDHYGRHDNRECDLLAQQHYGEYQADKRLGELDRRDFLSGLMALGPQRAKALAEREEIAALFILRDDDGFVEEATPGFDAAVAGGER